MQSNIAKLLRQTHNYGDERKTPNLIIEHLCAIRAELHEIREEQREQCGRLGSIERSILHMTRELGEMGLRLDRMHDRLDRIERRLDLVNA